MRLAALLFVYSSLHAADWTLLRVPGIDLYTNASDRSARQTLDRLGQIRSLLGSPAKPEPIPLRVILFATRGEYLPYARDESVAGFYQSGVERDYIVTSAGNMLDRVIQHEYVHFVTTDRGTVRAAWLEEGLADFYSTFDGKQIGAPIPAYLQILERRNLLGVQEWLSAAEMNSPRQINDRYYAQAWALVHMLRREPQFPELITEKMIADLRQYVRAMRPTPAKLSNRATPPTTELVSRLNAQLLLADLALRTDHTVLARQLYSAGLSRFSQLLRRRDWTRHAGLRGWRPGESLRRTESGAGLERSTTRSRGSNSGIVDNDARALQRSVELNPDLAEAHILLGVRATDDGELDVALQHLERATQLDAAQVPRLVSLGYAQERAGRKEEARQSLDRALQTAVSREQREMAATLLDSPR